MLRGPVFPALRHACATALLAFVPALCSGDGEEGPKLLVRNGPVKVRQENTPFVEQKQETTLRNGDRVLVSKGGASAILDFGDGVRIMAGEDSVLHYGPAEPGRPGLRLAKGSMRVTVGKGEIFFSTPSADIYAAQQGSCDVLVRAGKTIVKPRGIRVFIFTSQAALTVDKGQMALVAPDGKIIIKKADGE